MLFRSLKRVCALAALIGVMGLGHITTAQALPIVSLVGDKDGFGLIGAPPVPVAGTWTGLGGTFPDDNRVGDPSFTDIWEFEQTPSGPLASPISYVHSYVLPATILSAVLSINEAGMSDARGPWDVSFNSTSIGLIGSFPASDNETFKLLSFAAPISLLTGSDSVTLTYLDTQGAGFAINFSELLITIPEPSTALLFASGLVAMAVGRRRT